MIVTVSPATNEEVRSGYVGPQLREFNYGYAGEYPEVQYVRLNARDPDGQVVGAENAALETFEWQAPGFYARHGYEEVVRMEKYIGDFYLAIMRKRLRGIT